MYMAQLRGGAKQVMKQMLGRTERATASFVRDFDNMEGDTAAEKFGATSDNIKEMLDNMFEKANTKKDDKTV